MPRPDAISTNFIALPIAPKRMPPDFDAPRYRPNVAAILRDAGGRILVCERFDRPGAWQFPQGGIDPGETSEQALARELVEEISVAPEDYRVVERRGPYRYLLGGGRKKKGFHGQEQQYFLVDFTGAESRINVLTAHQEFRAVRWIAPWQFDLAWLPEMKREVYRAVLKDFFDVNL